MNSGKTSVQSRMLVLITVTAGLLAFFVNHKLLSQETHHFSEAPVFFKDGERRSSMIYVKFNQEIIDLPKGVRRAALTDFNPAFPPVRQKFQGLKDNYADCKLYKAIPSAVWGDVVRTNRRTGELVTIEDMSQLLLLHFSDSVPIDDIISERGEKLHPAQERAVGVTGNRFRNY